MNFNTVDLHTELLKIRRRNAKNDILDEVNDLLQDGYNRDINVKDQIKSSSGSQQTFDMTKLNPERIYTLDQIKSLCIKYRLRFLDASIFKGEIPYEAVLKIKEIEKEHDCKLESFKIVAPKKMFQLSDKDSDPILFLRLTNNRFYFIHKWGGEINVFRSLLAFPFRNVMTMFWSLFAIALVFTICIPTSSAYLFAFLLVHSFIGICGLACLVIFSLRENLSNIEWDSRYYC
ncbi:MAG: hypothetical protein CMO34_07280 [Verrucomicrobia bacterium]|nr:hypothetical protein [Verrucomicrobiota bacterium]